MSTLEILVRRRARIVGVGLSGLLGIFLGACSSTSSVDAPPDDTSGAGGTDSNGQAGATTGGAGSTGGTSSGTAGSGSGTGGSGTGGSGTGGSGMGGSAMMGSGGSLPMLPPAKGTCGTTMPAAKPVVMQCAASTAVAPSATWTNITGTLAGLKSECGNLSMMSAEPCTNRVIAGVARQGLFATSDNKTWTQLGTAGTDKILHRASTFAYDPEHAGTFWESGIYGWETPWSMGVFKTTDDGASFKGYLDLSVTQSHMDSVSVDFSDPARTVMLVGGHEQKQVLYISLDSGVTFKDIGKQLPTTTGFCTTGLVMSNSTQLVGCAASFSGLSGAILRTTDCGATFKQVNAKGVSGQPLWASDGTIYWAAEGGGMLKSTDLGLTWVSAGAVSGRPQELPDGRILSTNADHAVVTKDGGTTWTPIGNPLPVKSGVTYSAGSKTLYAWHNDCNGVVLPDAVMAAGWDYTTQ